MTGFQCVMNNFKQRHIEYKLLLKERPIILLAKPVSVYIITVIKLHEANIFNSSLYQFKFTNF